MANLAQPVPPPAPLPPVSVVIPVRDRSIARAARGARRRRGDRGRRRVARRRADPREARAAGARYMRREARGGAGAARNDGPRAGDATSWSRCMDTDCVPLRGLARPAARRTSPTRACDASRRGSSRGATRVGAARRALRGATTRRSTAGPRPRASIPYGRVPFVPGAALVVRRHLRFDETLAGRRGRRSRLARARTSATSRRRTSRTSTAPTRATWLARRVYYGRTAAPLAKRHPGKARPLHVSPWTTAAWAALAARHPKTALAITATATALLARESSTAADARVELAAPRHAAAPAGSSPTRSPGRGGRRAR